MNMRKFTKTNVPKIPQIRQMRPISPVFASSEPKMPTDYYFFKYFFPKIKCSTIRRTRFLKQLTKKNIAKNVIMILARGGTGKTKQKQPQNHISPSFPSHKHQV